MLELLLGRLMEYEAAFCVSTLTVIFCSHQKIIAGYPLRTGLPSVFFLSSIVSYRSVYEPSDEACWTLVVFFNFCFVWFFTTAPQSLMGFPPVCLLVLKTVRKLTGIDLSIAVADYPHAHILGDWTPLRNQPDELVTAASYAEYRSSRGEGRAAIVNDANNGLFVTAATFAEARSCLGEGTAEIENDADNGLCVVCLDRKAFFSGKNCTHGAVLCDICRRNLICKQLTHDKVISPKFHAGDLRENHLRIETMRCPICRLMGRFVQTKMDQSKHRPLRQRTRRAKR